MLSRREYGHERGLPSRTPHTSSELDRRIDDVLVHLVAGVAAPHGTALGDAVVDELGRRLVEAPHTSIVVLSPGNRCLGRIDAKVLCVERDGRLVGVHQPLELDRPLGTEVREVLRHVAERPHHVPGVLGRVEDVGVPHLVDHLRQGDGLSGLHEPEFERHLVVQDGDVGLVVRHVRRTAVLVLGECPGNRLEVDLIDARQSLFESDLAQIRMHCKGHENPFREMCSLTVRGKQYCNILLGNMSIFLIMKPME